MIEGIFLGIVDRAVWAIFQGDPGFPASADCALVIQLHDGSVQIVPGQAWQAIEYMHRFAKEVTYDHVSMHVKDPKE